MKPVLMIHEVDETIFDLPLQDYVLTFDDGLYSQYYYFNRFKTIPTEKIFFISTDIICAGPQSIHFPACQEAHDKAFAGNKEDYMTLEQIKELMKDPLVSIGGHSHSHCRVRRIEKTTHQLKHIVEDTKLMLAWFKQNLNYVPYKFCFPYNDDCGGLYKDMLKQFGFTEFYGCERKSVEMLQRECNQIDTHAV